MNFTVISEYDVKSLISTQISFNLNCLNSLKDYFLSFQIDFRVYRSLCKFLKLISNLFWNLVSILDAVFLENSLSCNHS